MIQTLNDIYVEKYRPKSLQDIALQPQHRAFFENVKKTQTINHLLFVGSPGIGKTSLGKIIINDILDCQYLYINASDENGIDTIRSKVIGFAQTKSFDGKLKVVLLDEADAISLEGQKALRNVMEEYYSNTRFILTCNYQYKLCEPLQSRCQIFDLTPSLIDVVNRVVFILKNEKIEIEREQKVKLVEHIKNYYPDLRRIINDVQLFSYSGKLLINTSTIRSFSDNLLSLFIKKRDCIQVRKFIIENDEQFSGNYLALARNLFESVFDSDLSTDLKSIILKEISECMRWDSCVVDKEINFFNCCITICNTVS